MQIYKGITILMCTSIRRENKSADGARINRMTRQQDVD